MSMISEQVNRLRGIAEDCRTVSDHITAKYIYGAADTIEELSAKLHNSQMERSSQYYNGGWIPVSERLPDKLNDVLVAFYDAPEEYDVAYMRKTFNATYKANGAENEWVSSMGETTYADYEISAWMPIPPYKSEIPTGIESGDKDDNN